MADQQNETEIDGGAAFDHPSRRVLPIFVGPSTSGESNTFRRPLVPIACWSIGDVRFEFGSSFIKPEVTSETPLLATLLERHAAGARQPALSVFGHADPTGADELNKRLSGRRAAAIYAMLTRDASLWENLFSKPSDGDAWGAAATQTMLATLGHEGPSAARDFQSERALTVDGIVGPLTRHELFLAYMDAVCVDSSSQPFRVDKSDFLGGGADAGGKGDFQGCGELNPALLLSQTDLRQLSKPKRDTKNTPNRRVIAFLFPPDLRLAPERWPCPRATEDTTGCTMRLFSDGQARRTSGPAAREYKDTRDTFACRFYDRLAKRSPCEGLKNQQIVEVAFDDPFSGPRSGLPIQLTFDDGSTDTMTTDGNGSIFIEASRGLFADTRDERNGRVQERRVFLRPPDVSTANFARS